ncbi:Alpha/Beta hydrolase protein [Podospora didyma]|uniref:carboxypeptidase C n=1 Tax=Podospora didyma TaxID=330526 RepID=A0AAE0NQQ8_9PEZI|nr:Alpha/Beta hydrolase protein [Podospora didyma]
MRATTVCAALTLCWSIGAAHPFGLHDVSRSQKPVGGTTLEPPSLPRPSVRQHAKNADICVAGTRQYTGSVPVSPEKDLFFWFFESRNDPANSPVIVWLNGGPGGSSMFGLFEEIGPCQTNEHFNGTVFNKHSWTEFANVVFIDQPAGVGFSTFKKGHDGGPDNLLEAAQDFSQFLTVFFHEIFPEAADNDFHIAGESFAGRYIPGFTHYINQRQQLGGDAGTRRAVPPIQSIILVDAVVDAFGFYISGHYDHFCGVDKNGKKRMPENGFNETACDSLEKEIPECERLATLCGSTYDPVVCETAVSYCDDKVGKWFNGDVYPGGRDPYDDRKKCGDNPPICEPFNGTSSYAGYLNSPHVKEELGFSDDFVYAGINDDISKRWEKSREAWVPTTRELTSILDTTPTRVLVLNGNNDIGVNTEAQNRIYDRLPWSRQAAFRSHEYTNWQWPDESGKPIKGGKIKTADDLEVKNKLAFVSVDEAGHASVGDQQEALTWLIKCWTDAKHQKDERCPL